MRRSCSLARWGPCAFAALLVSGFAGCRMADGPTEGPGATPRLAPLPLPAPVRAIWVARMHYRYPEDVRTIIRNCARLGCNTVLWQVRGEGTVAYPSQFEPWAREFGFTDPNFDPLALAVQEAHRCGLRIEAWVNVMPGWKGPNPPPLATQLYHAHPAWFMYDAAGNRQPLGDFYVILNPCLPEVRRHVTRVVEEIATRYDVDGIHLDYVRYAWDGVPNAKRNYPRDARTLALYRRETGRSPDDDPTAWNHWRANQLTRLVADIRAALNRRRRGATLTAAVWSRPSVGYRDYLQNSVAWLRTGLVDALLPMAYTDQAGEFAADIAAYRELVGSRRLVPGVGLYKHNTEEVLRRQLTSCGDWGGDFALFSYASLYPTHQDRAQKGPVANEQLLRRWRRAVLAEFTGKMAGE